MDRIVCATLLLAGLLACSESNAPAFPSGAQFPAARLSSLTGSDALLPEAQRGTALVINFWATWCEPCRKEMPSLERLHRRVDAAQLRVIGVSVDNDLNLAREFVLQHSLTFAHYTDSEQKLARGLLKIQAFPATFVVAADGSVTAQITGARDWSSAETLSWLERVLDTSLTAN